MARISGRRRIAYKERLGQRGVASVITPNAIRGCLVARPGLLGTPGLVSTSRGELFKKPLQNSHISHFLYADFSPEKSLKPDLGPFLGLSAPCQSATPRSMLGDATAYDLRVAAVGRERDTPHVRVSVPLVECLIDGVRYFRPDTLPPPAGDELRPLSRPRLSLHRDTALAENGGNHLP
jgi:hypothetical protein